MVFWASVLVFLASIMIYVLLPVRVDDISVKMYQDDPYTAAFLNQHQAAKDFAEQLITWNEEGTFIHIFTPDDLAQFITDPMYNLDDINDGKTASFSSSETGSFKSGLACLDGDQKLTTCSLSDTGSKYIVTYGNVPTWWDNRSANKKLWLTALRKRTHGSELCGTLEQIKGTENYAINNGQRYGGLSKVGNVRIIPSDIATKVLAATSNDFQVLMCITPFKNPYVGTPVFHWDISNINGKGRNTGYGKEGIKLLSSLPGTPLIGSFSDLSQVSYSGSSYTISGVVNSTGTISSSPEISLTSTSGNPWTFKVGSMSSVSLPEEKPFAFTYIKTPSTKKLIIARTVQEGGKYKFKTETFTKDETDSTSSITLKVDTLNALRIYDHILSDFEIAKNNKVDKKRFGL